MKKMNFTKQLEEYDCGPATVSMILKNIWGIDITLSQLKIICSTTKNGTSFLGIKKGFEALGIESTVAKCECSREALQEITYPCITQVKGREYHFVTIFKVTKRKIYIGDPSKSKVSIISIEKFLKQWNPIILEIKELTDPKKLELNSSEKIRKIFTTSILKVKRYFVSSWILSIVAYLISIYLARMFSMYFDLIIPNKFIGIIGSITILYLGLVLLQFIINAINAKIRIKTNKYMDKFLLENLAQKYFRQDFNFIEQFSSGELISRFNKISDIRSRYIFLIQTLPLEIITILVTTFILMRLNVFLTLLAIIPIIIFFLLYYFSKEHYARLSFNLYEKEEELNIKLIETVNNIESIKNYNITRDKKTELINRVEQFLSTKERFSSFDSYQNLGKNLIVSIFNICLFSLGSYLVINDNLASGLLLMFNTLASNMFKPFINLANLQASLEQGKVATLRYSDIACSSICLDDDKLNLSETIHSIELKNVTFSYNVNSHVLDKINLKINAGEKIALIGSSGSGKSTLAKIIANYYKPNQGDIFINYKNTIDITQESIRKKILYVPPNPQIFNDTLLNNITLKREGINLERIEEISEKIGFDNVVNSLPEKYNTVIGSKGVQLSTGQQQLLNVVRYTLFTPEILILDEITNGLDIERKDKVINYLLNAKSTIIFITHDINLSTMCQKKYILSNGDLKTFSSANIGKGETV
ncbi:peptidase domain-containing ABC transporter [Paenibacillus solani]|uniref:peptidase domain-containing ABC transporter n=1 Tax=Paenibacillus solani TaxID=1705565 RepID=UPI003D2B4D2A